LAAESTDGGFNIDPMYQFDIKSWIPIDLGFVDLSFTNSAFFAFLAVGLVVVFFLTSMSNHSLVPTRMQSMAESLYEFVRNMVHDSCGDAGLKYFPYIFTLFLFILGCNLLGMVPYSFTVTSHFAVTVFLALAVFITVTAIGFIRHGIGFLGFFWPMDAPAAMRPVLAVIEVISYFVRPVSHSIRLGANMMAGHAVLKVFAGFVGALGVFGVIPIAAIVGVTALEFLVAVIQAYVFAILTCVYLHDALHMH
jgi:F-type H+-transporting ATPase subunit a